MCLGICGHRQRIVWLCNLKLGQAIRNLACGDQWMLLVMMQIILAKSRSAMRWASHQSAFIIVRDLRTKFSVDNVTRNSILRLQNGFFQTMSTYLPLEPQFNADQSLLGNYGLKMYGFRDIEGQSQRWCHHIKTDVVTFLNFPICRSKFSWDIDALL